jgi:hypothetical protein
MAQIEQLPIRRRLVKHGVTYVVDAVLFRRVSEGASGMIRRTDWRFGADSRITIKPDPAELATEILSEIEAEANDRGTR